MGLKRNIKPLQTISEIATSYENTLNWLLSTDIVVIIFILGYYDKILGSVSSELKEFISPYSYLGMLFAAGIFLLMASTFGLIYLRWRLFYLMTDIIPMLNMDDIEQPTGELRDEFTRKYITSNNEILSISNYMTYIIVAFATGLFFLFICLIMMLSFYGNIYVIFGFVTLILLVIMGKLYDITHKSKK